MAWLCGATGNATERLDVARELIGIGLPADCCAAVTTEERAAIQRGTTPRADPARQEIIGSRRDLSLHGRIGGTAGRQGRLVEIRLRSHLRAGTTHLILQNGSVTSLAHAILHSDGHGSRRR